MPIKPENKGRYPADWDDISLAAKQRAGWKCVHEGCTARQYAVGMWLEQGVRFNWYELVAPAETYAQARQNAAEESYAHNGDGPGCSKVIVIVLTTAHLDHNPENCAPENLAPMCQRHHLAYDQKHHNQTGYMTRMAKRNNQELDL